MPITHAYVVPFRRNAGQTEVLVGVKQVVSYEAVARQMHNLNLSTWRSINFENPLKDNGDVNVRIGVIGKRFDGVLLPAGGKPAFFGGSREGRENPQQAAIREFKEEVGLHDECIEPSVLGEAFYTADWGRWGGAYFALNVENVNNVNWNEHLVRTNQRIQNFENEEDNLARIANDGYKDRKWYPEMHNLSWVPVRTLDQTMNGFDDAFMNNEVRKFAIFLLERVQEQSKLNPFNRAVQKYMLQEKVDGNVEAAVKFQRVF